jgi:hypothetical protein
MLSAGFEPTIPVSERLQTHALDRTATGIGITSRYLPQMFHYQPQLFHYQPQMFHYQPQMFHYQPQILHYQPQMFHYHLKQAKADFPTHATLLFNVLRKSTLTLVHIVTSITIQPCTNFKWPRCPSRLTDLRVRYLVSTEHRKTTSVK